MPRKQSVFKRLVSHIEMYIQYIFIYIKAFSSGKGGNAHFLSFCFSIFYLMLGKRWKRLGLGSKVLKVVDKGQAWVGTKKIINKFGSPLFQNLKKYRIFMCALLYFVIAVLFIYFFFYKRSVPEGVTEE